MGLVVALVLLAVTLAAAISLLNNLPATLLLLPFVTPAGNRPGPGSPSS